MDIKQLRQKTGLRAQDVAQVLGVAVSTVNAWEQGRAVPRFEQIRPLMNLYKVNFEQLEQAVNKSRRSKES